MIHDQHLLAMLKNEFNDYTLVAILQKKTKLYDCHSAAIEILITIFWWQIFKKKFLFLGFGCGRLYDHHSVAMLKIKLNDYALVAILQNTKVVWLPLGSHMKDDGNLIWV